MTFTGVVVDGKIELENAVPLPEGAKVQVVIEEDGPTLAFLLKYAGKAADLPPDMAEQHDHYIHGTPRK